MSVMAERALALLDYLRIDGDTEHNTLLEALVLGLLAPADRLSLIAHGDGGTIGPWAAITDPAVAPLWALPHSSQWTGGVPPQRRADEDDATYLERGRAAVLEPRGMRRGSDVSLALAALPHLGGTQSIRIVQFPADNVWRVLVLVKGTEVLDPIALEEAVNHPEVIRAGMRAEIVTSDQPLWQEATVTFADVDPGVTAVNVTLADVT